MSPQSTSRREFLKTAAVTAAAAATALPLAAEPRTAGQKAPRLRLGFSLYGMRSLPIPKALQTCAEIGYDGVELAAMSGWPCDPETLNPEARARLRTQLADLGLELSGLMENLRLLGTDAEHAANLDRIRRAAELAHDLAPERPPVIETILGGKPAEWMQVRDRFVERLRDWAMAAGEVTLAIKPHIANALHTPGDAVWLCSQVGSDRIRLAYDYSHFELQGIGLAESLQAMLPQTRFIHVKDTAGDQRKFQFLLPGKGRTDYKAYFATLREANYKGPVVVEVSGQIHSRPDYDPVAAAREAYLVLARAARGE